MKTNVSKEWLERRFAAEESQDSDPGATEKLIARRSAAACSPCAECGMPVDAGEYHPFAACLMFKGCHDSATVKANLWAVQERSMKIGWENHEDFCRENANCAATGSERNDYE